MTRTTLTRPLLLAVSIAAATAPSASARPIDDVPRTEPPARVFHVSSDPGFDWGDAGAGAMAATIIGLGGAFALRNRRRAVAS
jgi:hypothetical protein